MYSAQTARQSNLEMYSQIVAEESPDFSATIVVLRGVAPFSGIVAEFQACFSASMLLYEQIQRE